MNKISTSIVAVLFIVLAMFAFTLGVVNIDPTEVGIKVLKLQGKVMDESLGVGYHFYNRWTTNIVVYKVAARAYPRDVMKSEEEEKYTLNVKSNDGQNVNIDLTCIYALREKEVSELHIQVGKNYEDQVILPQIRSEARIVVGSYSAEEMYQGQVRDDIQKELKEKLTNSLSKYPAIQIQDTLIRDFSFSTAFEEKIEQKKLAAQQVEINKNLALAQEEESKRQEAEARGFKLKAIQTAEGEAQSVKINADARRYQLEQEAKGNLAIYTSDAEGKRLQTDALGGGEYVVGLRFAEKLAPGIQTILVPISEKGNYFLDFSGIIKEVMNRPTE